MKILRITTTLDPRAGGTVEFLEKTNELLREAGHEIDVVTLDHPKDSRSKDLTCLGPGISSYSYSSRYVPWLKEHADKYDAVLVDGIWQFTSFGVWLASRKKRIPYYVFTHGMLDPWFKYKYPLKHMKKWLYWPWGEYRVLKDARKVFFTCEEERLLARKSFWLYKCNEEVIRCGTKDPGGDGPRQKEEFFLRFPELKNKRILLFMGRLHEKKGCDLLIKAFSRIYTKKKDLHLVIAGPDQVGWRKKLEKLVDKLDIRDRVTWTGMLEGDMKWGAFHAAEAFILPSHQENFGIVVAEALACGTPVLITDKVNIWREIKEADAGFVESDTVVGIKKLIEIWISLTPDEKAEKRDNAKRCFDEKFDMVKNIRDLIGIIKKDAKTQ